MSRRKNKRNGFTLLELQIASVLLVLILVVTGVIFYFGLASIRYLHDALKVYTSATNAMKVITHEVMQSNCYGDDIGANFSPGDNSFYGAVQSYIHGLEDVWSSANPPAGSGLNGTDSMAALIFTPIMTTDPPSQWPPVGVANSQDDGIFLRQAPPSSSERAEASMIAGEFGEHDSVMIYLNDDGRGVGTFELMILRADATPAWPTGADLIIAEKITELRFYPVAYNCVGVTIAVRGDAVGFLGGGDLDRVAEIRLSKVITLRCAPDEPVLQDAGGLW